MGLNKYIISNPVGTAKICQALQLMFSGELDWLAVAYGEAFRNFRNDENGNKYYYPAIYKGEGEYLELVPDQRTGNSVFFTIDSPENYNTTGGGSRINADVNAIFFADLRDVSPSATHRALSEMKAEIVGVLSTQYSTDYELNRSQDVKVFDRFEDVYSEYSYKESDQLPNMSEYAVLRVNFNVFANNC